METKKSLQMACSKLIEYLPGNPSFIFGPTKWKSTANFTVEVTILLIIATPNAWAEYKYLAPKFFGQTTIGGKIAYYDSGAAAMAAYVSYAGAQNSEMDCPPIFGSIQPAPFDKVAPYTQFRINGSEYTQWGAFVTKLSPEYDFKVSPPKLLRCINGTPQWQTHAYSTSTCPIGWTQSVATQSATEATVSCYQFVPKEEPCDDTCTNNPVMISRGEKIHVENDYHGPNGLSYSRTFRGKHGQFLPSEGIPLVDLSTRAPLAGCETRTYLKPPNNTPTTHCFSYMGIGIQEYGLRDARGRYTRFTGSASAPQSTADSSDRLVQVTDNIGNKTWQAKRKNNSLEIYSASGRLLNRYTPDGRVFQFGYDARGMLVSNTDVFGRKLQWINGADGRVAQLIDPAGGLYDYGYDAQGNLTSVTYPPDASGTRRSKVYHYESSYVDYYRGRLPLLTGITDETGHRFSTYVYDSQGRATSTSHHLTGGGAVNTVGLDYSSGRTVTDPLGTVRSYSFSNVLDYDVNTGITQPGANGVGTVSMANAYDGQRNRISRDDYTGKRTCYAHDLSRNLETTRVEGLATGSTCSTFIAANASLPTGSRKTSSQWHPDWRLETRIAEPGKITTLVYNGQPDPTAGNALASCAPGAALLPDGKPIAVLCKRIEQATTDANGAAGFAAAAQAGVASRIWTYTYNPYGQVLTEDGPRTDVNDITTYAYHAATSFSGSDPTAVGVTLGDLKSVTNAVGKTTQFTKYNKHGQLLESIDPNGVVTTYTYDLRMRLLSKSVDGKTTSYAYDPIGQLIRVTHPNNSWIGFDYDGAHRQAAAYDNLGNRIDYTLDNAGNRIAENVKDSSGTLRRQLTRDFDALGRVELIIGRE